MLYRYWTIQVRPTPTSISIIGIGVVVEDPATGEMVHQFVEKPQSVLSRYTYSDVIARVVRDIERWLGSASAMPASLELDERFVNAGILDTMAHRWNNLISVNQKQYVSAESLQAAVDLLFHKLISPGENVSKARRVAQVRQRVRSAYESREPLRELIVPHPDLIIDDDLGERFDLGIIRDTQIFELNDAFSMHSRDPRQTEHRIQAWTWKMSMLRSSGAQLTLPDGATFEVGNQTPVVATLWPPKTSDEQKLLATMTRRWDKLGINYIEVSEIETHAEELSSLVA